MLHAYLDESGIHQDAEVCVIAAYFAGTGQWRKFEAEWRKMLKRFSVPLEKFHAKDILKRRGIFNKMAPGKYADFLEGIADVITKFRVYPVSQSIIVPDFNSYNEKQKRFLTGAVLDNGELRTSGCPSKPYFVPFMHCVRRIAEYTPASTKVHLFFGLDRTFAGHATALLRDLRNCTDLRHDPWGERVGVPSFPLAKQTPQLQAADFIAYYIYANIIERQQNNIPIGPGSSISLST